MDHCCVFTGCFLFLNFASIFSPPKQNLFFSSCSSHLISIMYLSSWKWKLLWRTNPKRKRELRHGEWIDLSCLLQGWEAGRAHVVQMTVVSWAASCNVSTSGCIYYSYPRRWLQEVCISERTAFFWLQVTQEFKSHQSKKVHGRRKEYQYIAYI